jgi:hypothetical protein
MAGGPPKEKHDAHILGSFVGKVNIFLVESGVYGSISFWDGTEIAGETPHLEVAP